VFNHVSSGVHFSGAALYFSGKIDPAPLLQKMARTPMIRGPAAVSTGELSSNHMQEYNTLPVGKLQLDHLTAILLRNIPVKFFNNRLRFDRIMVMSL